MGSGMLVLVPRQPCSARTCFLPALLRANAALSCLSSVSGSCGLQLSTALAPVESGQGHGGQGEGLLSTRTMSVLHWGPQSRTQQKGRTTFLHLLPMLCLLQHRMQLDFFAPRTRCWLQIGQLGVHHDPRCVHRCFTAECPPAYTPARAFFAPGARLCSSPC